jgi:hypothetical protein
MKNIDEIDDNINELILQKSFDKLTAEEKQKALAHAGTEEEYNALRSTLLAITTSFSIEEEVSVDQDLKSDLLNQFEKKFGTSGNRVKIIPLYRKPFFQLAVAASVALLVFFSMPFLNPSHEKQDQLAMTADINENSTAPEGTIDESKIQDLGASQNSIKSNEEPTTTTGEKGPLEETLSESEASRDMKDVPSLIVDDNLANDRLSSNDGEKKELEKERVAVETKSKSENNNSNTISLLDQVSRERKDKESDLKKKSKVAERDQSEDLVIANSPKASGKKMDADKMLESAAGSVNEAYSPAPGSAIISSNVSSFVQENKTEILDLLFTTF